MFRYLNDSRLPDDGAVEIRMRSWQEEHADRSAWPWLPGFIAPTLSLPTRRGRLCLEISVEVTADRPVRGEQEGFRRCPRLRLPAGGGAARPAGVSRLR